MRMCFSWRCFVVAIVFCYGVIKDRVQVGDYEKSERERERERGREREKTESLSEGQER